MKYIIIMGLFLFFQSCTPNLERKDFVGIWKAEDGASVSLLENGSCEVRNLDYRQIYHFKDDTLKILSFEGNWDFITIKGEPKVDISYYEDKTYEYKGETRRYKRGFTFNIVGKGVLENKPPFDLYVSIGDPDSMNHYTFVKQ